ncbi:MAG: hypothetical protein BWY71_00959 [Planctomycetes bacterium ADurb.Bin412]|nr:MAG: hypothetical protein BWY71_00959 [Planctomycetes bacterium ADurb.Bin412]
MTIERHDIRKIRCRMLGHEVPFGYCRQGCGELPCRKIFDCWFEVFPVEEFMREHYSREQIEKILSPPPDKVTTLIDLIQRAQQRGKRELENE